MALKRLLILDEQGVPTEAHTDEILKTLHGVISRCGYFCIDGSHFYGTSSSTMYRLEKGISKTGE